ncbi:hypothetical protein Tco_0179520 [Tanacetum coccineum]
MLAPVSLKSTIQYQWAEKTVPVAEGSSETTTERYMENYKNVSQDIQDQLKMKLFMTFCKATQNEVNEKELKDNRNNLQETEEKEIVSSSAPTYDPEPATLLKL